MINSDSFLNELISETDIKFICDLIDPNETKTCFIYQIVSNNLNQIDTDKIDYLTRDPFHLNMDFNFNFKQIIQSPIVIENIVCYPFDKFNELIRLFEARKQLHNIAVNNPITIGSQMIINEMIIEINKIIPIVSNISKLDSFIKLTDDFVCNFIDYANMFCPLQSEMQTKKLIKLTKKLKTMSFAKEIIIHHSDNEIDPTILGYNHNIHILHKAVCGYISGNKANPLDAVSLFKFIKGKPQIVANTHAYKKKVSTYVYIIFEK
jgi:hypothetical protein